MRGRMSASAKGSAVGTGRRDGPDRHRRPFPLPSPASEGFVARTERIPQAEPPETIALAGGARRLDRSYVQTCAEPEGTTGRGLVQRAGESGSGRHSLVRPFWNTHAGNTSSGAAVPKGHLPDEPPVVSTEHEKGVPEGVVPGEVNRNSYRLRRAGLGHTGPKRTGRRCLISARAFVIRFPNGDFEYDVTRSVAPSVGDTLRRLGRSWRVTRRTGGDVLTIYVERAASGTNQEGEASAPPDDQ